MIKMKCIIVDDEVQSCYALREDIASYCSNVEIASMAHSVKTAVHDIDHYKPELVFLDIRLGDGSGFDVLERCSFRGFKTVFTTAYDEYAIKAFRVHATDYLLKPVSPEELIQAVEKARQETALADHTHLLRAFFSDGKQEVNKISFQTSEGISIHEVNDILYCEANKNYCTIHFIGGTKLLIAKTLKDVEDQLRGNGFERIHQSYLINVRHLIKYINKGGGQIVLSGGMQLPVSRRKKPYLLHLLTGLFRNILMA